MLGAWASCGRYVRVLTTLVVLTLLWSSTTATEVQQAISVMPAPATARLLPGALLIAQNFSVAISGYNEPRLENAVRRLILKLRTQTGIPLSTKLSNAANATLVLHVDRASKAVQDVDEDESYSLDVTAQGAKMSAPNPLGAMHGLETFSQLVEVMPDGFGAPDVHIDDSPRFPWRGLMVDVSRHFIPVEILKRNLDAMAAVKMNVFHWSLSNNQGFRAESRVFPKLQEMGSDGLYYSQGEIRDLIEYARERGIRVIPEFDMPGHSTSWFAGYPELASGPGPYSIERKWGIFDPAIDPTRASTYKFIDKFVGEMSKLFPDHYFHIGGDELNGKQWDANPQIQEFKRTHGLQSNHELQAYFNTRVQAILQKHGKVMVGWDEVLTPVLARETVIQSWRGQKSLADAARKGFRGILSFGYYLDYMWPASQHYAVDPRAEDAATLTDEEKQRILGGEACMWTEYVSSENFDSRVWPRTAAIAERLWSPAEVQNPDAMYSRMEAMSWRLERLGLTHRTGLNAMLRRMTGQEDVSALGVLADVVEPVKEYTREELATNAGKILTSDLPLNRLVDGVSPESEVARRFSKSVDDLIAGHFWDPASEAQVRSLLTQWRDNDSRLEPLIQRSFLLKEIAPLSRQLSALGTAGLQSLDYLDKGERPPDEWKVQQKALIDQAKKPDADLLLMIAPSVQKLIEASASGG
jgi:hexosaminidase